MTDSDIRVETWKPIPGFGGYEASDMGRVRSTDRAVGGRQLRGTVLAPRVGNRGYLIVNLTDDQGRRVTRTVHTLVLETFAGPRPEGMESCHRDDDPLNNRWPENLRWDTKPENEQDKFRNGQPKPVPPARPAAPCTICGAPGPHRGRRCHDCVVQLGKEAAKRFAAGEDPDQVAMALDYPSTVGVWRLARKYGGARILIVEDELQAAAALAAERQPSPSVIATVRHILRLGRR